MSLLLCAATHFEVAPTLRMLNEQQLSSKVSVLITGVGLPAATYNITRQVIQHPPSIIIQAGLAGSLSAHFPLTEVVAVERDCFGDLGVLENGVFKTLFDLKLAAADEKPWDGQWLINPHVWLLQKLGLITVSACSVNEISTNTNRLQHFTKAGAQLETMEGAALHYVALMEGIPFVQIRAVSNYAGERDKKKWALHEAVQRLNDELQRFLSQLISL